MNRGVEARGAIAGRAELSKRLTAKIDARNTPRGERPFRQKIAQTVQREVVDPFASSLRPLPLNEIFPQPPSVAPSYSPPSPQETLREVLPQGGSLLRALEGAAPVLRHLETPVRVALILATIGTLAKEARNRQIDVSGIIYDARAAVARTAESLGLHFPSVSLGVKLVEASFFHQSPDPRQAPAPERTPKPEKAEDVILDVGGKKVLIEGGRSNPNYLLFCSDEEFTKVTGERYVPEEHVGRLEPFELTLEEKQRSEAYFNDLKNKLTDEDLPEEVDLGHKLPPAGRQLGQSSCNSFAASWQITGEQGNERVNFPPDVPWEERHIVSPMWWSRLRGQENCLVGSAFIEGWGVAVGALALNKLPYTGEDCDPPLSPDEEQLAWAKPLRILERVRLSPLAGWEQGEVPCDILKQTLADGHTFVLGICTEDYGSSPEGKAHAVVSFGYNAEGIKCLNSWGPWGPNGDGTFRITWGQLQGEEPLDQIFEGKRIGWVTAEFFEDRDDDCQFYPEVVDFCPTPETPTPTPTPTETPTPTPTPTETPTPTPTPTETPTLWVIHVPLILKNSP